jgi:hypothetical protein
MKRLKYEASTDDLDHLWKALEKLRQGSASVKVEKEALTRVLLDYGRMVKIIKEEN